MPLLQGQPFKLISSPDIYPANAEVFTIQHTGEKFLSKSDYEDRLALYSQSIWTCQCSGHTGYTHKEAWMSEAKLRIVARNAVPLSLQKPLLVLVHHSLSPLEQLIDAASILCHSQYHVGEELLLLYPQQTQVRIMKSKDIPKIFTDTSTPISHPVVNGIPSEKDVSILNGSTNGLSKGDSPGTSPGKENQSKELQQPERDDSPGKRDMLPRLYDVYTLNDQKLVENVPAKHLLRPYKIPSKDQIRLFIRSCALRHKGSTCTPWVVTDDLIRKFNIPNKLPLFISSPKSKQASAKRKSQSPPREAVKRPKTDTGGHASLKKLTKVPPIIIKSEQSANVSQKSTPSSNKQMKFSVKDDAQHSAHSSPGKMSFSPTTKHPLSIGKPKIMTTSPNFSLPTTNSGSSSKGITFSSKGGLFSPKGALFPQKGTRAPSKGKLPSIKGLLPSKKRALPSAKGTHPPRKRGRPPLSQEEKERNKKLRQASLMEFAQKMGNQGVVQIKTSGSYIEPKEVKETSPSSSYLQTQSPSPVIGMPYKSPIKRANTPEAIMRLPLMQRFVHEHKTIKGVRGQFRRYAYTRDLILAKISPAQIQMIPDEALQLDLLARQKKVQDKKFIQNMTPEERKEFIKNKARTVALERWKERKLRNLKVEDKTVSGLLNLPEPTLVETPPGIPNMLFGDVVMITDFIKCFQELLLGEENFQITTSHIMEAIAAGSRGCKVIVDIICTLLPTIVHDDISKDCKELGVRISIIPITYQTAQELARLCLRKQEEEEVAPVVMDEIDFIGKEKKELSDELLGKLECSELWELNCVEIVAVLKALVHKALCTASLSVYVGEVEDKVLKTLRERRKVLRLIQKQQKEELEKRKEQRIQSKMAKDSVPKKQRGRPRVFSPKQGPESMKHFFGMKNELKKLGAGAGAGESVLKRRLSAEKTKKEMDEVVKAEKGRVENEKRRVVDRKYEAILTKRDNMVRRTPIGVDRDHNRYWIFHSTAPGLYVEKGWVDASCDYTYSLNQAQNASTGTPSKTPAATVAAESETPSATAVTDSSDEDKPLAGIVAKTQAEDNKPLSCIHRESKEDSKPLAIVKSEIQKEMEEDNRTLSKVKSKLTISPMKMAYRGRPPKEAYVLVDEDTQTFPHIGKNKWYYYRNMEEVKTLISRLSDEGLRESQLIAAININEETLQYHYNKKCESLTLNSESADRLKQSLKDDIIQIEKELIEGWLGGVPNFEEWELKAKEAEDVSTLGTLLIDAQRHMQIKYLKSIMAPYKEVHVHDAGEAGAPTELEEVEGPGVERWREAVKTCKTYSRLHVLVGVFDSCIKWERSMATRKCKICRSKLKADPMVMCDKCESSYHMYCLRPPLKEDPGETWTCPACMPKKTRREEKQMNQTDSIVEVDQDEKEDPTFSVTKNRPVRSYNKKKKSVGLKPEKECSVCTGRIGLIFCSKCSTAFHSECHDPPLLSRARKDWVCGLCLYPNPKLGLQKMGTEEALSKPEVKRNCFSESDDLKKRCGNSGPRDKMGRFLKGKFGEFTMPVDHTTIPVDESNLGHEEHEVVDISEDKEVEVVDVENDGPIDVEDDNQRIDKFGRGIRGAKAKALENITVDGKSRRSSRNQSMKKNYKDQSEEESDSDEDGSENSDEDGSEKSDNKEENEDGNGNESEDESNDDSENENNDESGTKIENNEREVETESESEEEEGKENDKKEKSSESGSSSGSDSDSDSDSESDDDSDTDSGKFVQGVTGTATKIQNLTDMSSSDESSSEDNNLG